MKFSFFPTLEKREAADFLILPFWEGPIEANEAGRFEEAVSAVLKSGDFKGKLGETAIVYLSKEKEPRLLLLGLGKPEKATGETLRRAFGNAAKTAQGKKAKNLNLILPKLKSISKEEALRGIAEGILLANYAYTRLKQDSLKENPVVLLERVGFIGVERKEEDFLEVIRTIAGGVEFTRELVNGNADDITPKFLAETAMLLEKSNPRLKTEILDKKKIEQEKMGLLLAVNRASSLDPYLIITSYRGNPKSKDHVVLVGKGVTYDTGGLTLKPPDNMMTMKSDMSGAATVLGVVQVAAALNLKINVTAVAPATENCIDGKSYKLGDVYRSHSGKTVEVNNTDAEGRLILADAISYAVQNLKPTCLIDLASLTGAIVVALGEEISGFFTNNDGLSKDLMAASEKTGELLWRMPLYADYKEALKSDIADLVNTGGRDGGAIKAGLFIQEFVGSVPWVHIDFAGPCYITKPKHYNTTKATGFGVRLLVEFLMQRANQ